MTKGKPRAQAEKKVRFTLSMSQDIIEAARNAVYWTPGASLNGMIEAGLRAEVKRLEKKRGEPFPKRKGQLKTGPAVRG